MELISVLEAALSAGAAAGLKAQADEATQQAVRGLRALLSRMFGKDPAASASVEKLAAGDEGGTSRELLTAKIEALSAQERNRLAEQCREVLRLADPIGMAEGRYSLSLDIRESQGIQVNQGGTGNMQCNTFN